MSTDTQPTLTDVHWAGDGTEVQVNDDTQAFPGDMEAALFVAVNTHSRWITYTPQTADQPWAVFAYVSAIQALEHAREAGPGAFYFDGHDGAPPDGPDGIGYTAPQDTAPASAGPAAGRTTRERREARADRLDGWAAGNDVKAGQAYQASHDATAGIPFGQPILVGHHSERRHRRAIQRSDDAMRRSVEAAGKAQEQQQRAENVRAAAARAIYDDDPDAIQRLTAKLRDLEGQRDRIKAYNANCRKAAKTGGTGDLALLDAAQQKDITTTMRVCPYQVGAGGQFPSYALSNLGGVITAAKQRIAKLSQPDRGRVLTARYEGECRACGGVIEAGEQAVYFKRTRELQHPEPCGQEAA